MGNTGTTDTTLFDRLRLGTPETRVPFHTSRSTSTVSDQIRRRVSGFDPVQPLRLIIVGYGGSERRRYAVDSGRPDPQYNVKFGP